MKNRFFINDTLKSVYNFFPYMNYNVTMLMFQQKRDTQFFTHEHLFFNACHVSYLCVFTMTE